MLKAHHAETRMITGQAQKKQPLGCFFEFGAGNEIRTRDPNLGKVVLYH